jgi:hypothetical protein
MPTASARSAAGNELVELAREATMALDALLAEMPDASFDASFQYARDELLNFQGVQPLDPPWRQPRLREG